MLANHRRSGGLPLSPALSLKGEGAALCIDMP